MKPPLIPIKEDFKWRLLSDILNIFDLRSTKQILSQYEILPLENAIPALKIVLSSMFFCLEISYVVRELEDKKKLRKFMRIKSVPSEDEVYSIMSCFDPEQFINFVIVLLNNVCSRRKRGLSQIIIDSTDIDLDLNWFKRKISKKMLENRQFKWGHSTHRGYFIGMKLSLALEYPSLKPLAFVVNEANVSEYTVYPQILEELQRRRKIRAGDILYFDKGYYSYENYVIGIAKYKIVPIIFPKINCNFNKLFDMLRYPLNIFDSKRNTKEEKKLYKRLVAKFKSLIENWGGLRPIRSLIEDVFKLAKKACNMENLHRYTMRSVKKYCSLAVFLTGAVIAFSICDKKMLQRLAES
ncbi:MAG: transposase [Methanobacterium sp.]